VVSLLVSKRLSKVTRPLGWSVVKEAIHGTQTPARGAPAHVKPAIAETSG
jgi:hypothetical protein